ncbi:T9SS type A sorting domain-containing protein [Winogradskyella sp.]|uniref:T9SS type A sorting domain-containing protein n=1 Tax=Winogradskyella sp. TaxID=1883156 RepID=UPI002600FD42|nr:T9SS type A sorting domain-containing protein [Winogradskyella sp.]
MKKIIPLLLLLIVFLPSFAIDIVSTSASQVIGGLNVNVKTFEVEGFNLLSSDFSIEDSIINLSICYSKDGTLAYTNLEHDFFIPLINSGNYTINVDIVLSSFQSTICDSSVVTNTASTTAEYTSLSVNSFEDSERDSFSIYPNPASTKVNLDLEKVFYKRIYLLDSFGRVVRSFDELHKKNIEFDISDLNDGIYFIVIEADNRVFYKKLLKK